MSRYFFAVLERIQPIYKENAISDLIEKNLVNTNISVANIEKFMKLQLKEGIWGLFIGNISSYLSYKFYITNFYITFENPPILGSVIAILLVSLIVSILIKYSIYKLNKQSIIETIRNENI